MTLIEQAVADVKAINKRLASGTLFFSSLAENDESKKFMENVSYFNLDPAKILALSLNPDGDNTVIGRIMTQDETLYYFDFDLDNCEYSSITPVSAQGVPDEQDSFRNNEYLEEVAGATLLKQGFSMVTDLNSRRSLGLT